MVLMDGELSCVVLKVHVFEVFPSENVQTKQNKTKSTSTTVTHVLQGVLWVLIGNGLYDYLRCDCKQTEIVPFQ